MQVKTNDSVLIRWFIGPTILFVGIGCGAFLILDGISKLIY